MPGIVSIASSTPEKSAESVSLKTSVNSLGLVTAASAAGLVVNNRACAVALEMRDKAATAAIAKREIRITLRLH